MSLNSPGGSILRQIASSAGMMSLNSPGGSTLRQIASSAGMMSLNLMPGDRTLQWDVGRGCCVPASPVRQCWDDVIKFDIRWQHPAVVCRARLLCRSIPVSIDVVL